jgi:hypothetical protein
VGVGLGKDHTIFAVVEGAVEFATKRKGRVYVSVRPLGAAQYGLSGRQRFLTMQTFRNVAVVAAVMLVTTAPASACAGGGWKILHLECLCCWIWGNDRKGCKQSETEQRRT